MKTNAIVRIVLFSIAIVVLLGILVTCLAFGLYIFDNHSFVTNSAAEQELPVVSDESTTEGAVYGSEIRNLEIEWVAGTITVEPDDDTSNIIVKESGYTNSKYGMVCSKSGDTLKIQFSEDSIKFPSLGINADVSKNLVITVPADWTCETLEIDAASASVEICNLQIDQIDFDGASGACKFNNCTVGTISMDTASGDVVFSGTLDILDFDGASANCSVWVTNVPRQIDIDTASGDLELYLPDDCGFSCDLSTLSGSFSSDFEATTQNGHHVYGDGSCAITVDAMSGDVCIRKHGSTAAFHTTPDETLPLCYDSYCTDPEHDHSTFCTTSDCTDETFGHSDSHSSKNHD